MHSQLTADGITISTTLEAGSPYWRWSVTASHPAVAARHISLSGGDDVFEYIVRRLLDEVRAELASNKKPA